VKTLDDLTKKQRNEVKWLYIKYGWSLRRIGEKVGLSRTTILKLLKEMGINTSRGPLIIECDNCQKHFVKQRSIALKADRANRHLFCSRKCFAEWMKRTGGKSD